MRRVLIDDVRNLPPVEVSEDLVYRNAQSAMLSLVSIWCDQQKYSTVIAANAKIDELYLDHDLGPGEDVRPIVYWLEVLGTINKRLMVDRIYVVSANPIAVDWIKDHLSRYYKVSEKSLNA